MPVRLGVIGLGYGAAVLIPAFRSDPRAEVAALVASRPERAREAAAKLGVPHVPSDWRGLVEDTAIDAIVIAAPPAVQAIVAKAALLAGKPVFAEKPLASDAATANALADLAAERSAPAMIDFNFRAVPEFVAARALLAESYVGALWQISMSWHVENFVNRARLDHWKARSEDGGGALGNFVSHSLDLFEWLGEPIVSLQSRLARFPGDVRSGETLVTLGCEFSSGASGSLSMSAAAFAGAGHRIEIYGSDGALILENPASDYMHGFSLRGARRDTDKALRILPTPAWPGGLADYRVVPSAVLASKFLDWVVEGAPQEPNFGAGARVQTLMECVRRSAQAGGAAVDTKARSR